jgi:hypothetical protein
MQNWSKNVEFNDKSYLQPTSLVELQELIRTNPKVRTRGTAHCFNEIANTSSTPSPFYRPHWGKVFTADATYLKSVYPKMGEFQALVQALDPTSKFENSFTRNLLL